MPIIASGENCVIIAPTGAGKTEAAVIPILDKLRDSGAPGIKLIYITPLRALNRDMIKRLESICRDLDISIAVRHGDTPQSERGKQARKAPIVLITTPETLQSILPTKTMGLALKNVSAVIIDEIHELYYNKRGAQLSIALERLEELAPNYQRIGISATVGDPDLVKDFLVSERKCRIAVVDNIKQMRLSVELPKTYARELSAMADLFGLDSESLSRLSDIVDHIKESKSTIIFGNTRQIVEALGSRLMYIDREYGFGGISVHHGSLDKKDRMEAEDAFKAGKLKSIIATSSLELGIDIGSVDLVVQYGSPRQALRLVQRVGRSGHSEKAVSKGALVTVNVLDAMESIAVCRNAQEKNIERFSPHSGALDVLANQVCGMALEKGTVKAGDVLGIIRRSYCYRDFGKDKLIGLLEFMNRQRMVGFDGVSVYSGGSTRMYYYSHLSVIPDSKRYMVKNIADNRIISSLDEGFVANNIDENSVFITKGLPWKVVSIDEEKITVEPSSDLEAAIPDWSGEDIPVSRAVSGHVFDMMNGALTNDYVKPYLENEIKDFIKDQGRIGMPSNDHILIETSDEYQIIHTGLGTLANEALSRMLAYRISSKTGKSINMKSSPYLIFLEISNEINPEHMLMEIGSQDLDRLLISSIDETEVFRYKFLTVAKLFGIIEKGAPVSRSISRRIMKLFRDSPVYDETIREITKNYFDVKTLNEYFGKLNSGKLKIKHIKTKTLSPISRLVLNSAYFTKELIMPLLPNDVLVESFSKFLLSKNIKMLCTYCGFHFTRKLSELRDQKEIRCPNCESPMITQFREEYRDVVKKRQDGKRLTKGENEMMKEILKQASLFDSYGGRAAIALSTYGVGPTSAARILMMLRREEKFFFVDLIEAQKLFIKNKKYWSL